VQHLPHLGVGDSVLVTLPKGALLKGSLLLYGVPVFTVLFASALGTAFGFGDLTLAGWVLGLFALSFLVMKWWQHRADKGMALQVLAPVVAPELLPVKGS
jgi:positive regulator of sigma E activity